MRVAFLGLGIMGQPMAANLAKAGHEVTTWNRTPGKTAEGARTAATPAEAAANAEAVWMCVSDTAAVNEVLWGENGVGSALKPGVVVVDSSTISPSAERHNAERIRQAGGEYIDAPMTGSKIGARDAQLVFMAGGESAAVEKVRPLFDAMGKAVHHVGGIGLGQAAKLAQNLQNALIFESFAEGLTLATKLGVPPEKLVEIVKSTMTKSGVVEYKANFVLNRDFSPNFPLRLMYKDIKLMLEAAREARVKLPALETVAEIYEVAIEEGQEDLDYAATLTILEKWAGIQVKASSASS
jgi:3-hydroxyisobutyrate dehydrogenase-like beta-hydroxyacid dehydrogenase